MSLEQELSDIYRRNGELTAALVVEAARPVGSPLHDRFEWDDHVAGEAYRRIQAGALIRSVKIRYGDDSDRPSRTVRKFVNTRPSPIEDHNTYMPVEEAARNDFTRQVLLRQMRFDWMSFQAKYERFKEFSELITGEAQRLQTMTA